MILRENFHENKKGQYMNALISVISIILFIVLGIIIYNGLNGMDLKKKIIIFIFEIIVCLIFTMILFNISFLSCLFRAFFPVHKKWFFWQLI